MLKHFDKTEIARRQLGTGLQLFIDNADPVSVHVLAAAGMELAEALAAKAGRETFKSIAIETNPNLTETKYHEIKNQWWNSFKHFYRQNGKERDDAELLSQFDDRNNEHMLLIGWLDFGTATGGLPIEAQCFQAWFFAIHPDALTPDANFDGLDRVFPGVRAKVRAEQKNDLRRKIRKARQDREMMQSSKTERRKLLLPNDLDHFSR